MAREDCALCKGTGWKLVPRKDGTPGQVALACECGMEERAGIVMDRARVPKRYEDCNFENFETELEDGRNYTTLATASLKLASLLTRTFVMEYPAGSHAGLLIMGRSGVGKTHLAIAALRELVRRGHTGYFCEYGALLREIQNSYRADNEMSELRILQPILSAEVLVIDDLGCIKPSDWVRDTIGYILNSRYVEASQDLSHAKCTIITTNFLDESDEKQAQLPNGKFIMTKKETLADRIGERMRSRLYEICRTIKVEAPDFRKEVRQAGRARA
jgi:DNA replication protein DnaC